MPLIAATRTAAITMRECGLGEGAGALLRAGSVFGFLAGEAARKSAPQL
jgi:hypothetical protein